jgi:hypothetical protein
METPRVFISYSHDSPEHSEWVRKLATNLRQNGVDAFLDVWDIRPGENFTQRIEKEIASADHCIVVCTPRYREVAEKRRMDGVGYEGTLIRDAFREKSEKHPWVLPIVREGTGRDALPDWLVDRVYIDWRDDTAYSQQFKRLLQAIFSSRRKPSRPPEFPGQPESSDKTKVTLTINADIGEFDDAKIEQLRELLKTYLGEGVTITEKKSG